MRAKAAREAYDYQVAAVGYTEIRGSWKTLVPKMPLNVLPIWALGASLLSGASMLADKWRNFQNSGRAS